jgi:hypothetical protein
VFTDDSSHSSVCETTHIISSKRLSAYSDFPMPADYPDYPSHRQLLAYFEAYAERFSLMPRIRFDTEIVRATPIENGAWRLHTARGDTVDADALLIANGHHWDPRWPSYPGTFTGRMLHAHAYKTAAPFRGERVLVIGGGNSACDIAVETSRISALTAISWRRGYHVVPKLVFGQPPDVISARIRWLPRPVRRALQYLSWRLETGGNEPYGLPKPDHGFLESHPVVNSELLYFLRHGRIQPYPDVERFEGRLVRFVAGRSLVVDSVIAATGYRMTVPFLDEGIVPPDAIAAPLYLQVFHPDHPRLYFIGLVQPVGCIWPLAEAQTRLVARHLSGRFDLPADAPERIAARAARQRRRYVGTPRHSIEVDFHDYLRELDQAARMPPRRAAARPVSAARRPGTDRARDPGSDPAGDRRAAG